MQAQSILYPLPFALQIARIFFSVHETFCTLRVERENEWETGGKRPSSRRWTSFWTLNESNINSPSGVNECRLASNRSQYTIKQLSINAKTNSGNCFPLRSVPAHYQIWFVGATIGQLADQRCVIKGQRLWLWVDSWHARQAFISAYPNWMVHTRISFIAEHKISFILLLIYIIAYVCTFVFPLRRNVESNICTKSPEIIQDDEGTLFQDSILSIFSVAILFFPAEHSRLGSFKDDFVSICMQNNSRATVGFVFVLGFGGEIFEFFFSPFVLDLRLCCSGRNSK